MDRPTQENAPDLLPLGPDGILIRFADKLSDQANRAVLACREEIARADLPGVTEVAASLVSILVKFRPDCTSRASLSDALGTVLAGRNWRDVALPSGRRLWRIPAAFGGAHGPALAEVAEAAGLSTEAAIEELCETRLRVLALGFAPGQPYLGFLSENWDIPRQTDVTPEVPQGAVVVAVRQVIPFANASPTGWRQVGRTAFRCFDVAREQPVALAAGDEVQFTPIDAEDFDRLDAAADGLGGAVAGEIA